MAKRKWGSPAQRAALRKAQLASARARRGKSRTRRHYSSNPRRRGVGVAGLQKNTVPYARINQRSGTVGVNSGTFIPFTNKRIAIGGYFRVENRGGKGPISKAQTKVADRLARKGTKPGAARKWFNDNVIVQSPAVRANVGGAQVRLGTSRSAGSTVIVRRGSHKPVQRKSMAGVRKYDKRMRAIAGQQVKRKKKRPQRRR